MKISIEGECVVVYIWHDSDAHTIEAFSFADFIYSRLVTAMTDMSHLLDDLSSAANARLCLLADIRRMTAYLPADEATRLQAYLERPVIEVEVSYGRRTERVPCLITDEDYMLLMQGKRTSERWPVNIVASSQGSISMLQRAFEVLTMLDISPTIDELKLLESTTGSMITSSSGSALIRVFFNCSKS